MIRLVCWKWQDKKHAIHPKKRIVFTHEHVNVLYSMLQRNIRVPFELYCITDDPTDIRPEVKIIPMWDNLRDMGGCYCRLRVFSHEMKKLIGPDFFSIDLDVVIVGDITGILQTPIDGGVDFKIWGDTNPTTPYNGSFFYMKAGARAKVWDTFDRYTSPRKAIQKHYFGTDQAWIGVCLGVHEQRWTRLDGIYSFRVHFVQRKRLQLQGDERIIFFHGQYDPSKKCTQDITPWIAEHWRL